MKVLDEIKVKSILQFLSLIFSYIFTNIFCISHIEYWVFKYSGFSWFCYNLIYIMYLLINCISQSYHIVKQRNKYWMQQNVFIIWNGFEIHILGYLHIQYKPSVTVILIWETCFVSKWKFPISFQGRLIEAWSKNAIMAN